MKWMIIGLLFVGVLAALSATIVAVSLPSAFNFGRLDQALATEDVEVLVATRDLGAMTIVDSTAVATQAVQPANVPNGALHDAVQVVGQVLVKPVLAGQPFTSSQFAAGSSGVSIAAALPEGYRAMGILLSDDSGIEELLYPGSVVDVVASFRMPAANGGMSNERVSATILQKVQVLSVGRRTIVSDASGDVVSESVEPSRRRIVTLMVNTEQAKALQLAVNHGTVSIALRNPLDEAAQSPQGTYLSDLSQELAETIAALAETGESGGPLAPPRAGTVEAAGDATTPNAPAHGRPAASADPQYWITTIMHGRLKATESFPMSETLKPHGTSPVGSVTSSEADEAAQQSGRSEK